MYYTCILFAALTYGESRWPIFNQSINRSFIRS